ncbi:MAG TPA: anti-sigma factor [Vicinamibacterales bacterium]|nr:anti-sigma factor [Vicinamibacterales bacterium]
MTERSDHDELRDLGPVAAALAQSVPQVDPPASLRAAILESARQSRSVAPVRAGTPVLPWLAAAAMLVVSAGLGLYVRALHQRIDGLEGQLRDALVMLNDSQQRVTVALRASVDAQAPLAVLTAPDVRQINLAGQKAAPAASARAFWSRSRGVVFTAANLPVLPAGRIYQLWFIAGKTPVSAGLLTVPNAQGSLTTTIATPADLPNPDALAVSIEPTGGSPLAGPTGDIYLIGAAH